MFELHQVAQRHLGPVIDRRHHFADATIIRQLVVDAGFNDVRIETLSCTTRLKDAAGFLRMNATAIMGMSPTSAAMDDAKRAEVAAAIADDSSQVLPRYTEGEEVVFVLSTNVATARS